jgi:regulator of nonsense transcripts 3
LIGPPSLEFAPYNKVASGRAKNDSRQGTIDQDPEFIDFLQKLTEPINKAPNGLDVETPLEKATTTPLVEYLKEKKANKAKEAAEKKSAKARQQDTKEAKPSKTEKIIVKSAPSSPEKAKVAKAGQEAVKAINKSVAQIQAKPVVPTKTEAKTAAKDAMAAQAPAAKKERPNISAAARIQRDLGLAPKAPRAARNASAAGAPAATTTGNKTEDKPADKPVPPSAEEKKAPPAKPAAKPAAPTNSTPPTGPRAARNNTPATSTPPTTAPVAPKAINPPRQKPAPQPSPGATSAFLKHANPSQGVTEELLRTVFSTFGTVTRCEIDRKKGLAYVDFETPEALKKAMAASPVTVGDKGAKVVVLENNKGTQKMRAAATQKTAVPATVVGSVAKVNSPVASPKPVPVAPAAASPAVPPSAPATAKATNAPTASAAKAPNDQNKGAAEAPKPATATATPPTAPRNSNRGGGQGGGRGGRAAASGQPGRGGGGSRGRGANRGRGGAVATGGAGAPVATATSTTTQSPAPAAAAPKADSTGVTGGGGKAGGDAAK